MTAPLLKLLATSGGATDATATPAAVGIVVAIPAASASGPSGNRSTITVVTGVATFTQSVDVVLV